MVLHAAVGVPDHMTTWELLALLVALRGWGPRFGGAIVLLRSDNVSALFALHKGAATAPGINRLLQELPLHDALSGAPVTVMDHVPGVLNDWPDRLSRLEAPEPREFPAELSGVARLLIPERGREWYRTADAPCTSGRPVHSRGPLPAG